VGFYLSNDSVCTTADTFLTSRVIPSLAGLTNHAVTTAMTIPSGTALGAKYICAIADDQAAQAESNEANNTRSDAINIVAKPDLVITTLNAPDIRRPGQAFQVKTIVQNNGLLAAGPFRIGIYLSDDTRCVVGDTFLGSRNVAALAVGATNGAKTNVAIPAAATLGNKTLCAIADDLSAVSESIESNNTRGKPILIQP
jgi:subtilase family serine protease